MTECDDIVSVKDVVSTKETNVVSTPSINCHSSKVSDCFILHTVLLAIILLLVTIIFAKRYNIKWKIMN